MTMTMRPTVALALASLATAVAWGAGCSDDESTPLAPVTPAGGAAGAGGAVGGAGGGAGGAGGSSGGGGAGYGPGAEFERFCEGQDWAATRQPATVGEVSGEYLGVYDQLPDGSLLMMKVVPPHPFELTTIRLAYAGDPGPVRVRLMTPLGRSYPDMDNPEDLFVPIEMTIDAPDPNEWVEIDVSDRHIFLEPTQHYVIASEQLEGAPLLAVEDLPEGEVSRALMIIPGEAMPYGSEGNFRIELAGNFFCAWDEADFWFGPASGTPFAEDKSSRAAFTDLDSDGHDDLVVVAGGAKAYLGDGQGSFAAPGASPFPADIARASVLTFADMNNDGHVDALATADAGHDLDADNDGQTRLEGDCDDTDENVYLGAAEIPDNGRDDDCDGTADDGTDDLDADADGMSILAGDCDDTKDDVYLGAVEARDRYDNDCDGLADEDYLNHLLLNDGTGQFTVVAGSGVEILDQSSGVGIGDGNGDGAVDLYWGNWLIEYPYDPAVQDAYFEGNGDGTFVDAFQTAGLELPTPFSCYGVIWNDFDNDGHQDIFVGNYHMYANQLWQNQGDGTFLDMAEALGVAFDDIPPPIQYAKLPGGHTYGGDFGDVDNDGDMDFYMANLAHPRVQPWGDPSMFVINQGSPDFTFVNQREEYGFIYDEGDVNATFADFDNDMDIDIAIASLYQGHYSRLYRNDGPEGFVDVTYETHTAVHDSTSVVWSDVDEDGDLDLVIADRDPNLPNVHLFMNRVGDQNGWVELVLEGTTTNRGGIGARVTLSAGGVTQLRDVRGGGGHINAQSSRVVHFGLGQQSSIDEVTVRWVGGGTEAISGLAPGGRYLVVEGSGQGVAL